MTTPPNNPFTIHVIEPQEIVSYIEAHRPSVWSRVLPYVAHAVTGAGRGLAQCVRLVAFVLAEFLIFFLRAISMTVTGTLRTVRALSRAAVATLVFVYIKVPLFLLGVLGLAIILGFVYAGLDATYLGYLHRSRP